ncbi:hypothetical protein [Salegentibacter chungangensis]|uniref:SdiA-regulated family protein n=1 Tax=Salegentibacter chungangensis TaxID=1335724 RepID=A0ABW3NTN8_9FLAO
MNKVAIAIVVGVCVLAGIIFATFESSMIYTTGPEVERYKILKKWDLPIELEEISGFVMLSDDRLACIQDEEGIIFIYNLNKEEIEEEYEFGGNGDYEGLAVNGNDAYVLKSNGTIYEVKDYASSSRKVREIQTVLTARQNTEGLSLDTKNNRLLITLKDSEKDDENFKNIYAYDLGLNKLSTEPVIKIDLRDSVFSGLKANQLTRKMSPSEISIHPSTGEYYIVDGPRPKLLILDKNGKPRDLYLFDPVKIAQPEGIGFTSDGRLFISNEGHGDPGNVMELQLE